MPAASPALQSAAAAVVVAVQRRLPGRPAPFLVALDGPSGAGKSTLAALVAQALGAAVVPGDDFFAAHITDGGWEARGPAARARDAIDWRRLRADALEPLLAGRPARWQAFDFEAGPRGDGTYPLRAVYTEAPPARVIVVDGAYSARPELADLIDLAVLVDAPAAVRRARLAAREDPAFLAAWYARWEAAETHYFTQVRPPDAFDLVVTLGPDAPPG